MADVDALSEVLPLAVATDAEEVCEGEGDREPVAVAHSVREALGEALARSLPLPLSEFAPLCVLVTEVLPEALFCEEVPLLEGLLEDVVAPLREPLLEEEPQNVGHRLSDFKPLGVTEAEAQDEAAPEAVAQLAVAECDGEPEGEPPAREGDAL